MKKFLAILLLLAMCVGMFAACTSTQLPGIDLSTSESEDAGETGNTESGDAETGDQAVETLLDKAVALLTSLYKDSEGAATRANYTLVAQLPVSEDVSCTVAWTASIETITITMGEGLYDVQVPVKNDTEVPYTLTATITDPDGNTVEKTFTRTLPVYDNSATVDASDIQENTAYKMFLVQASLYKTLYATNQTQGGNNKYILTTEDPTAGADFYAEKVEGGYKFYTTIDGVKNYLHAKTVIGEDDHVSKYIGYATESDCVYFFKQDCNAWFVTIGSVEYSVGTYSTYDTICISEGSYMTSTTTGVTQFPLNLILKTDAESGNAPQPPEATEEVPAGEKTIAEFLEIALALPDKGNTTTNKYTVTGTISEIKSTEYGNMYIKDENDNELYIYGLYSNDGSLRFDKMEPKPVVGDVIVVIGVACNYNGAQMKNAWLLKVNGNDYVASTGGSSDTPDDGPYMVAGEPVIPAVGTAYKLFMVRDSKTYYVTGEMASTYYFGTDEDSAAGVDFAVEATEGGFYLTCTIGGAKKYVNVVVSGTHVNSVYEDTAATVWTADETLKTLVTDVDGTAYMLGTSKSKTYTTLGPVAADSDSYYAQFATLVEGERPAEPDMPDVPEGGAAATITFADVSNRTVFNTEQQVWVMNGITVTNNKTEDASDIADYSNPARFYKNSELTIAYTGMTTIVITTTGGKNLDSSFKINAGTLTVDGTTAIITFENPVDSVTFASLAAQIRVVSIEVYTA